MSKTSILIASAIACVGLAGCVSVTAPQVVEIENSRTYAKPEGQVWESVIAYLAKRNFPIKTVERDSGIIYAELSQYPVGFADCGQSPYTAQVSRDGGVTVVVKGLDNGTQVTVSPAFKVTRAADGQQWSLDCQSAGTLERQILDALNEA